MANELIDRFTVGKEPTDPAQAGGELANTNTTEPTGEPTAKPTGEPTTEPVAEPTTEPTGEPTGEPVAGAEPTGEPQGEPTEVPEHVKKIVELAGEGFEFKSDNEVKEFFTKYKNESEELKTLTNQKEFFERVRNFIYDKKETYDPVLAAGGEERYRKGKIAMELAKVGDPRIAAMIVDTDIEAMDDLSLLILQTQYEAPKLVGRDKQAMEVVLEELGVDVSAIEDFNKIEESLSEGEKGKLIKKAAITRRALKEAINSVEIPDVDNPINELHQQFEEEKSKSEELKNQWEETRTSLKSSLDKIQVDKDFDFDIPVEAIDKILDGFYVQMSKRGLEPNDANQRMVIKLAKEAYEHANWAKIKSAYRSAIETSTKAQINKERNNQQPLTTNTPAPTPATSEAQAQYYKSLGLTKK